MAITLTTSGTTSVTCKKDNNDQMQLNITAVRYNDSTGKLDIDWEAHMISSGSRYSFAAGAVYINGNEVSYRHGASSSWLWTYSQWNNGTSFGSGTYSITANPGTTQTITIKVTGMWNYGWSEARWSNGTSTYDIYSSSGSFTVNVPACVHVNVGGVWKTATAYVNVNGTWKQGVPYANVSGTWKVGI